MIPAALNWTAIGVIAAVVIAAAGGVAKLAIRAGDNARAELAGKLDKIGAHLRSQDKQHDRLAERVGIDHRQLGERVARLEASTRRVENAVTNHEAE